MYIGTRLIGLRGILITIVIRLVAAVDTGRFKRVEDGKYIGVISAY